MDDAEEIYKVYCESRLRNAVGAAALGVSLATSPASSMEDTTYNYNYSSETLGVLSPETVANLWSKYYQGTNNKHNTQRAIDVISDGVDAPDNAINAINTAVYIFGGDEGVSPNVLYDLLLYTGEIETGYRTKKQYEGGIARGYWQIEPETAIDLIINSRTYFGKKFRSVFGDDILKINKDTPKNREIISNMLLEDDSLAASFAAAKWLSVAKVADLKNIKN